jgi:hypothetical protein
MISVKLNDKGFAAIAPDRPQAGTPTLFFMQRLLIAFA